MSNTGHQPAPSDTLDRGAEHVRWMQLALELAVAAGSRGEVPVGAVIVQAGQVIGQGSNSTIGACDPTAHAELVALREAAARCGNHRLPGASLYVSIEPCTMCAGALVHARIQQLVYGAREPRAGAVHSSAQVLDNPALNHRVAVIGGVLAEQAGQLVQDFFRERRLLRDSGVRT